MSGNLLDNSNEKKTSGLSGKFKSFFSKDGKKEYSDNFAKEKETIAEYKTKINEEKKENIKTEIEKNTEEAPIKKIGKKEIENKSDKKIEKEPFKGILKEKEIIEEKKFSKFSISKIAKIAQEKAKEWQAPKMVTTNLIQNEVLTYMDWSSRIRMLSIAVFVPVFISIFAYFVLIYMDIQARAEANILGAEIETLNKQVEVAEKKVAEVDQFKGKLALIENLLDKHIYWTNLFSFLENNILSTSIILGGFSGDAMGEYSFSVIGETYSNVPEQIMILRKNDLVESVEITEAKQGIVKVNEDSKQKAAVTYNLKLKLDPRIFYNATIEQ